MKIAAYTASRNLYADMIPAVNSLLQHSDVDKVYFLIEDDVFPYYLSEKIEVINISDQKYFPKDGINYKNRFTYMVLIRAAFAKIFPQYDKILSLDVDTIVDKDISDIWNLPIDDYYFSAALEPYCSKGGKFEKMDKYYNVGVALYNLKKLRDGKVDEVIESLNTVPYDFLEQDCFNKLCEGHILDMSSDYNACNWTTPTGNPRIVHYAGIKNWSNEPLVQKYR